MSDYNKKIESICTICGGKLNFLETNKKRDLNDNEIICLQCEPFAKLQKLREDLNEE